MGWSGGSALATRHPHLIKPSPLNRRREHSSEPTLTDARLFASALKEHAESAADLRVRSLVLTRNDLSSILVLSHIRSVEAGV